MLSQNQTSPLSVSKRRHSSFNESNARSLLASFNTYKQTPTQTPQMEPPSPLVTPYHHQFEQYEQRLQQRKQQFELKMKEIEQNGEIYRQQLNMQESRLNPSATLERLLSNHQTLSESTPRSQLDTLLTSADSEQLSNIIAQAIHQHLLQTPKSQTSDTKLSQSQKKPLKQNDESDKSPVSVKKPIPKQPTQKIVNQASPVIPISSPTSMLSQQPFNESNAPPPPDSPPAVDQKSQREVFVKPSPKVSSIGNRTPTSKLNHSSSHQPSLSPTAAPKGKSIQPSLLSAKSSFSEFPDNLETDDNDDEDIFNFQSSSTVSRPGPTSTASRSSPFGRRGASSSQKPKTQMRLPTYTNTQQHQPASRFKQPTPASRRPTRDVVDRWRELQLTHEDLERQFQLNQARLTDLDNIISMLQDERHKSEDQADILVDAIDSLISEEQQLRRQYDETEREMKTLRQEQNIFAGRSKTAEKIIQEKYDLIDSLKKELIDSKNDGNIYTADCTEWDWFKEQNDLLQVEIRRIDVDLQKNRTKANNLRFTANIALVEAKQAEVDISVTRQILAEEESHSSSHKSQLLSQLKVLQEERNDRMNTSFRRMDETLQKSLISMIPLLKSDGNNPSFAREVITDIMTFQQEQKNMAQTIAQKQNKLEQNKKTIAEIQNEVNRLQTQSSTLSATIQQHRQLFDDWKRSKVKQRQQEQTQLVNLLRDHNVFRPEVCHHPLVFGENVFALTVHSLTIPTNKSARKPPHVIIRASFFEMKTVFSKQTRATSRMEQTLLYRTFVTPELLHVMTEHTITISILSSSTPPATLASSSLSVRTLVTSFRKLRETIKLIGENGDAYIMTVSVSTLFPIEECCEIEEWEEYQQKYAEFEIGVREQEQAVFFEGCELCEEGVNEEKRRKEERVLMEERKKEEERMLREEEERRLKEEEDRKKQEEEDNRRRREEEGRRRREEDDRRRRDEEAMRRQAELEAQDDGSTFFHSDEEESSEEEEYGDDRPSIYPALLSPRDPGSWAND
ncbi:hypothetical protein BLNAU_15554 [Blattamonas nauphoetae]|uniref:Uncharacterized protein n=1 Tax=Blattamonas nauphoetae TaxID=2049346 RepID=A0ABQ9XGP5_9EUKA|nr:hypothetical protein BLNAU_15554 [Blattamonas nauphoetae]